MLAGEHIWTVTVPEPHVMEVNALSREDGRVVASWKEATSFDGRAVMTLVPLDGAVVACAVSGGSVVLLRVEEG